MKIPTKTTLILLLNLIFTFFNIYVKAQNFSDGMSSRDDSSNSFEPSLAVVIGMLAIMFCLTFILLLYAKFCHRPSSAVHNMLSHQIQDGLLRSSSHASGIDKTVVESLPFFRFSSLKGTRDGLECAVCLAKFEDIEILRLLPKCKHAFHIACIDKWLEKHSTCPLCRQKVSADDLLRLPFSNSLRFIWNQSEMREDSSNLELYIEREESRRVGSSSKSSFRKQGKEMDEEELPIKNIDKDKSIFHKFNHTININVSDVFMMKNRWSNVSSSDLMFLNSEMIGDVSSARFSLLDLGNYEQKLNENGEIMSIKEEMERKRVFESKIKENNMIFSCLPMDSDSKQGPDPGSKVLGPNEKRCMSEIVVHPRFRNGECWDDGIGKEERMRRIWLPIARKTVRWFANRERSRAPVPSHQGSGFDPTTHV